MVFEMAHLFFSSSPIERFTDRSAPDWLTSINTIKGSTMDNRWFWTDRVLKLDIGCCVHTDFHKITRVG